jgi:hypothetical protein
LRPGNLPPRTGPSTGHEQRQHARNIEERPAWLQWGAANFGVSMVDMSVGGARLVSPRPLSVGRPVKLQVGHRGIMAEAVVVRCAPRPDGAYDVGVKFVDDASFGSAYRFSTRVYKSRG